MSFKNLFYLQSSKSHKDQQETSALWWLTQQQHYKPDFQTMFKSYVYLCPHCHIYACMSHRLRLCTDNLLLYFFLNVCVGWSLCAPERNFGQDASLFALAVNISNPFHEKAMTWAVVDDTIYMQQKTLKTTWRDGFGCTYFEIFISINIWDAVCV